ncbi:YmfL family putative regulatory protein [Duganella sp. CT11-25]|uniref:YmfL family putative regulatory protein n=1 Tax=unclassified Duganella TaxID=2636909 RepID=UPI0039AF19D4
MDAMTTTYQEMIKVHGWIGTCAQLNMTRSQLEARVYEVKGSGMRVSTAQLLQRLSGTTLFAQAVAAEAGGVFIEMPAGAAADKSGLMTKFLELQVEIGELSKAYTAAIDDSVIDSRERRELEEIEQRMHKTVSELMATMFAMHCRQPAVIPE